MIISGNNVQSHLNIQEEAELLVEIEDIHDELLILKMILVHQLTTVREVNKILAQQSTPEDGGSQSDRLSIAENSLIENRLLRIESMQKMTIKTTKTVRSTARPRLMFCASPVTYEFHCQILSLLDLKQKQASIAEALASVDYARQQAEQSKETARQGRTLMLFTVVTILFVSSFIQPGPICTGANVRLYLQLPLSFMSAFFAIAIDAFPVDENGKLGLGYVLKYMCKLKTKICLMSSLANLLIFQWVYPPGCPFPSFSLLSIRMNSVNG